MIAKKVYGNEMRADYLMSNNMKLLDIFVFPSGVALATPQLPEELNGELPPWRD